MTNLEKAIAKDYKKNISKRASLIKEQKGYPKGYISKKNISGKQYYYLQYRDGGKIISEYLPGKKAEKYSAIMEKKHNNQQAVKDVEKMMKQAEYVIGNEKIKKIYIELLSSIINAISDEYNIKKATLFGSRATNNFDHKSDIDLIFEFNKKTSLLKLSEIKELIEDKTGLEVDVVHGPIKPDALIKVGDKEIIFDKNFR